MNLKENLDSLCHKTQKSWIELPIKGSLGTVQLPKLRLGLNIIEISWKYLQCQVTIQIHLRIYKVWFKQKVW